MNALGAFIADEQCPERLSQKRKPASPFQTGLRRASYIRFHSSESTVADQEREQFDLRESGRRNRSSIRHRVVSATSEYTHSTALTRFDIREPIEYPEGRRRQTDEWPEKQGALKEVENEIAACGDQDERDGGGRIARSTIVREAARSVRSNSTRSNAMGGKPVQDAADWEPGAVGQSRACFRGRRIHRARQTKTNVKTVPENTASETLTHSTALPGKAYSRHRRGPE